MPIRLIALTSPYGMDTYLSQRILLLVFFYLHDSFLEFSCW